jgi:hypothetical protein
MSRSAVYLIHKVRAGAMQRNGGGFSCGVKNLRNRMLSQGECERPVIRSTPAKTLHGITRLFLRPHGLPQRSPCRSKRLIA